MTTKTYQRLSDTHLEAYRALYAERGPFCFVGVLPDGSDEIVCNAVLGIAVANERGYEPIPSLWARFADFDQAFENADTLNEKLGLTEMEATRIVFSTMGGQRYESEVAAA